MRYGVCKVSIAAMRLETSDGSEMVSQVLYGELFKIIDSRKNWLQVRLHHDLYEGWVDIKHVHEIPESDYNNLSEGQHYFSTEITASIVHPDNSLSRVTLGAQLSSCAFLNDTHSLQSRAVNADKNSLVLESKKLLNAPYLWGGRTPFGIDCSGFTQLVYRLCGINIKRDASQQASEGEALSFIEEASPGDLAFFDNRDGMITHVGIIMEDNYIIHAHGKVRVDRLDQTGIYNEQENYHSHKLRVIKQLF